MAKFCFSHADCTQSMFHCWHIKGLVRQLCVHSSEAWIQAVRTYPEIELFTSSLPRVLKTKSVWVLFLGHHWLSIHVCVVCPSTLATVQETHNNRLLTVGCSKWKFRTLNFVSATKFEKISNIKIKTSIFHHFSVNFHISIIGKAVSCDRLWTTRDNFVYRHYWLLS